MEIQQQLTFIKIDRDNAEQRVDNFLFRYLKNVPKSHVYRIIRKGEVRINKKRCKPEYRLQIDDDLRIPPIKVMSTQTTLTPKQGEVVALEKCIIYEDKQLLILNKPSGIAVHGGSATPYGIIEMMRAARPHDKDMELVHRLDRDTSGCLILAKKRRVLRELHALLREGKVEKHYLALVKGTVKNDTRRIDVALKKTELKSGERVVTTSLADGKDARTDIKVVERYTSATLLDVHLHTGRTHQIRVHTAHINHPIAGDDKYGDRAFNRLMKSKGLKRMFLHAHSLAFRLPDSEEKIRCSAPLSSELQNFAEHLK